MIDRSIAPHTTIPSKLPKFSFRESLLAEHISLIEFQSEEDFVRITFDFEAGIFSDTKKGVSGFLAKLLLSGTSQHSAFEIQETFDKYGAFLDIENHYEYITVTVFCLRKFVAPICGFLVEVLQDVQIPEEEFLLQQNRSIENLKINEQKTSFIARRRFKESMFGNAHPYGQSLQESDILNISVLDCQEYYQKEFKGSLKRVISNTLLREEEKALFKPLVASAKPIIQKSNPKIQEANQINHPFADAVQASLMLGLPSIQRKHEDFPAWSMLSTILGGYFGSRLMKNIREDKGYTYGISAVVQHLPLISYLIIRSDVKNEAKQECIDEIIKEMQRLKTEEVSPDELLTVKNYMLGSLQRSFDGALALCDRYRTILDYDLNPGYYHDYVDSLVKINSSDLLKIANKYLDTSLLHVVVVGHFSE